MLKIRLTRRGKKNNAFFRLVVAEHTSPIKGKFLEVLGFLNPHTKEKSLKEDRIKYWIANGAQCSDTAHNFLVSNGIIKGPKRAVKLKKKPVEEVKEEAVAPKSEEKPIESEKTEEVKAEETKPEEANPTEKTEPTSSADKEQKPVEEAKE